MTTTSAIDPDVVDLVREVFATPAPGGLWSSLVETGLAQLGTPEEVGGSGGSICELLAVLRAAGHAACSLPLAEHDLLAGRLLGLPGGATLRTVAVLAECGEATDVASSPEVEAVACVRSGPDGGAQVAQVHLAQCEVVGAQDLAGQVRLTVRPPTDEVTWADRPEVAHLDLVRALHLLTAWSRAAAVSGAMDRVLELCVEHASTRTQFGRSIGRFQAVQQLVADVATHAALSRAVVDAVALLLGDSEGPALARAVVRAEFEVAAACSVTGHAASVVVRNAHQVLGALGTTREHELHRHTTRILAWRSEVAPVREWDRLVLEHAASAGGVWRAIAPAPATR